MKSGEENGSSENLESQWFQTLEVISRLLREHENGNSDSSAYGTCRPTKWKKPPVNCSNAKCQKGFGFFVQSFICKRCGGSFCKNCLPCEKRLNCRGEPDPNGSLQKICLGCFDEEQQSLGQNRSHLQTFLECHRCVNGSFPNTTLNGQKNTVKLSNFRDKLDLDTECHRLQQGFKESLKSSLLKGILQDVTSIRVPAWKKSTFWVYGNLSAKCYGCDGEFGLRRGRNNCVVCGSSVCGECSTEDLLVYIPDGQNAQSNDTEAELAIIRIIGCPAKEPEICKYLRICQKCNCRLQERQVTRVQNEQKQKQLQDNDVDDVLLQMSKANDKLTSLKRSIEDSLSKYGELVQFLDVGPKMGLNKPEHKSNMQVLAKAQSDLSDHITNLVTAVLGMKQLKPTTQRQLKILKNIVQSNFDSYHDYRFRFGELQKQLESVTPKDVLEEIQKVVNRNAINSCYMVIKQLALELVYLTDKHQLQMELLQKLITTEEVTQQELKSVLNEDWENQEKLINQFLDLQLKNHRFIRPSRVLLARYGSAHVRAVIIERMEILLQQTFLQLNAKSSDSMFRQTKSLLKQILSSFSTSNK